MVRPFHISPVPRAPAFPLSELHFHWLWLRPRMKQPIPATGSLHLLLHVLACLAFLKSGQHVTLQHAKGYFLKNNSSSHWCLSLGPVRFLDTGLLKFYVSSIAAAVTGFVLVGLVCWCYLAILLIFRIPEDRSLVGLCSALPLTWLRLLKSLLSDSKDDSFLL